MKIGMVGLGKMGANMTQRLIEKGHQVVAFDLSDDGPRRGRRQGCRRPPPPWRRWSAKLDAPRVAWVMVPAGAPTTATIDTLKELMRPGDVVIDGGNSNYKEAAPTAASLAEKGRSASSTPAPRAGCGASPTATASWSAATQSVVATCEPVFLALAPEGGYAHVGPVGAGHFVKMVHNGIEYGLMQAYGEGFEIMEKADEFGLDLHEIASIWRYGSVVRSWLLELAERALAPGSGFENIEGVIADSGEGRWTVQEAIDRGVPAPVITTSLFQRFASRDTDSYANRLIAALRNQFGGHAVVTEPGSSTTTAKNP